MQPLAEPITNLVEAFSQLPGIGPKTASRLTYFLLRSDESISLNLSHALADLKANTLFCMVCHNIADRNPCGICDDAQRDHGTVCVVEEPLDVQAIERTRDYHGVYHVLHGAISPVEGIGPEDLKIAELAAADSTELVRYARSSKAGTDVDAQSQRFCSLPIPIWKAKRQPCISLALVKPLDIRVTRLARGLPMGGDLEYADEVTLSRALAGRSEM
jgi:recombination protein RecR